MTYQIYYMQENSNKTHVLFDIEYYLTKAKNLDEWFSEISCLPIVDGIAYFLRDKLNDEKFDFVFMDANKGEYLKYYELADRMLVEGGIIAADNVLSHEEKVRPFVEAITNNPNYQVEILNLPAGLLIARKSL